MIHEEKTQTTCVLRLFGAPLWEVQQAVQQTGLAAQCRRRGAETLAALQAETPAALSKARKALGLAEGDQVDWAFYQAIGLTLFE